MTLASEDFNLFLWFGLVYYLWLIFGETLGFDVTLLLLDFHFQTLGTSKLSIFFFFFFPFFYLY